MDLTVQITVADLFLVGGNPVAVDEIEISINAKTDNVQASVTLSEPVKLFGALQIKLEGNRPVNFEPASGFIDRESTLLLLQPADTTERWVLIEAVKSLVAKIR
ncbi:MAG TPA: hypothetical protein VH280_16440 [Verrucomicrobiae bacterium]|jgi:hypothetical protein|nr:hypothetical protein [Verrucomicrobiae bacterium]